MDEVTVRTGTTEDFNAMMDLTLAATRENAFVNPDIKKLADVIWGALTIKTGICGVIGPVGGKLEGAVLLSMGEVWYSRELILEEKAIYVDPEYRSAKGGRAKKLADFAKSASDRLTVPLAIGVLSTTRTEAKIRLYERVFGSPAGVYFLYGAKTGLEKEAEGGS
ncbi:putative acetyltransferase [Caudoviricetes sp.]|nr:putative acetyltransferase [Caudoviricetes sp.]